MRWGDWFNIANAPIAMIFIGKKFDEIDGNLMEIKASTSAHSICLKHQQKNGYSVTLFLGPETLLWVSVANCKGSEIFFCDYSQVKV